LKIAWPARKDVASDITSNGSDASKRYTAGAGGNDRSAMENIVAPRNAVDPYKNIQNIQKMENIGSYAVACDPDVQPRMDPKRVIT
jgi:hypothetical protein